MSRNNFDELLEVVTPHIIKQNTKFRNVVDAGERLTIIVSTDNLLNKTRLAALYKN